MIKDLEFAVDRAIKDLREDKTIRPYAIQWEKRHQVLELNQSEVAIFTEPEIERLKSEYISLIKQHPVFAPESAEFVEVSIISRPLPNNNFEALIEIRELTGEKKTSTYPLHFLMQFLNIKPPIEFLQS